MKHNFIALPITPKTSELQLEMFLQATAEFGAIILEPLYSEIKETILDLVDLGDYYGRLYFNPENGDLHYKEIKK